MEPLSEESIRRALNGLDTGAFGGEVHYYARVGSTNDAARDLAEQGAPEGTLVIADEQIAGRGRMNRVWVAPAGANLLMTVLFRPTLPPALVQRLVMACGLAIAEAAEDAAGVQVDVKWPNDLQIGGRKFCGILPESTIVGERLAWVIVGTGVNVNQVFAADDPLAATATSLRLASGREIDRVRLLGEILANLKRWAAQTDSEALAATWRSRCVTLGQHIEVEGGGRRVAGLAEEIDGKGALWLRDAAGDLHRLVAGEATLVTG
jgi:BirA family biotin operon repressor/biotin-[acetyl-CoA-carboxylase] ligase